MHTKRLIGAIAAAGLLLAGCGSTTPQAQTVTESVPTTVVTTKLTTATATTTETETQTETVPTTVVTTFTYDPVAESKSKAAASSKASVAAFQKKGIEGFKAQLAAAGIPPVFSQSGRPSVDMTNPSRACDRLSKKQDPFADADLTYVSDFAWDDYIRSASDRELTALALLVKNVCPKFQPQHDAAVAAAEKARNEAAAEKAATEQEEKRLEGLRKAHKIAESTEQYGRTSFFIPEDLIPGTYKVVGDRVTDCYWELSDSTGDIIDNAAITAAPSFTVEVPSSAAAFSVSGCSFEWIG